MHIKGEILQLFFCVRLDRKKLKNDELKIRFSLFRLFVLNVRKMPKIGELFRFHFIYSSCYHSLRKIYNLLNIFFNILNVFSISQRCLHIDMAVRDVWDTFFQFRNQRLFRREFIGNCAFVGNGK